MKRMTLLLSAILCIISMSGCAETPEEVKADMSSYREENDSVSESSEFSYIDVADLSENAETALNKQYGQFTVSDKIRFVQPDEINIMSFAHVDDFTENAGAAMKLFYTEQEIGKYLEASDNSSMFMDDTDKVYCCVGDDGFIAMLKPDAYDISFSCQEPNVKIYHPGRNDDLSDVYQLKDGKCSVGDAVQYINNWFEANYKPLAPFYDYSVESVIVREHEGSYLYQMKVHAVYKGVALDSYTREVKFDDNYDHTSSYWDYSIDIQMINVNEIASFTNGVGIYEPTELERIDKCISMESALELCEKTFTNFKDVTVSDIGIMYTIMPIYEKMSEGEDRVGDIINEIVVRQDSRPVWEIVIDVPPEDFLADGEVNIYGDIRKYIYIDMITGEMKYDLEVNKFKG